MNTPRVRGWPSGWPPSSSPRARPRSPPPPRRPRPTSRPTIRATTPMPRWSPRSRRPAMPTPTSSPSARSGRATRVATSGSPRSPTTSPTDEPEPEVMLDSLHHAREHLSLEQNLAVLRWLTEGYGTDERITHIVEHSRGLDRLRGQPRRRRVRPDRLALPRLAQEPPAERRDDRDRDRPQPELRLQVGLLRRIVRLEVGLDLSRPEGAFSAPETRAIRDFMASRRIGRVSRSRPPSPSTRPVSRSCGRTATRRRTSRPT